MAQIRRSQISIKRVKLGYGWEEDRVSSTGSASAGATIWSPNERKSSSCVSRNCTLKPCDQRGSPAKTSLTCLRSAAALLCSHARVPNTFRGWCSFSKHYGRTTWLKRWSVLRLLRKTFSLSRSEVVAGIAVRILPGRRQIQPVMCPGWLR